MNFNKKKILISSALLFVFFILIYFIMMQPYLFYKNESVFKYVTGGMFSFYEYRFYTLVLIPMYIMFLNFNYVPNVQKIIRMYTKKAIAIYSMIVNIKISILFITIYLLVGIVYPILFQVFNYRFLNAYLFQTLFLLLLYIFIGNCFLILNTYFNMFSIKIGLIMISIFILHSNDVLAFNIFHEINYVIMYYTDYYPITNLWIRPLIIIALLLSTFGIKLYVSSEEEYW